MFWNETENKNEENYSEDLKALIANYNQELEQIKIVAQSTIADWSAYIEPLGIALVSEKQRKHAKTTGLPIPKVAFPSEYRAVLQQLESKTTILTNNLEHKLAGADDHDTANLLDDFIRDYLSNLVTGELKKYLDASKPKVSVSDIFANASTSLNKYTVKEVGDKSYSIKCSGCGAARLEEDQYDECFYCGTPLFKKE